MACGRCTAQVVFLIDCGIDEHLGQQRVPDLYKLACLRFLSSFEYNAAYKHLRWSYRFYSLDRVHPLIRTPSTWKEFSIETFKEFRAALDQYVLSKPVSPDDSAPKEVTTHTPTSKVTLASKYANVLCAVIEDFQWEIPDISSPVKSARSTRTTSPSIENYVFNLHLCPLSSESLTTFTGVDCRRASQLLRAFMSPTAKQKWLEKRMRLYWVDTAAPAAGLDGTGRDVCMKALRELNGSVLSLYQITHHGTSTNSLLCAVTDTDKYREAPATPVSVMLAKLLQPQERRKKCLSKPLNICRADNSCLLQLTLITHGSQLPVEYLYITAMVPAQSIRLHYLNQLITHLCTSVEGGNSTFAHFLVEMWRDNTVMVLVCKLDGSLYCLKPLTLSTATLTRVKDTCSFLVEELVKRDNTRCGSAVTGPAYTGALIDPTAQPNNPPVGISTERRDVTSHYEMLRESYRAKKLGSKLKSPAKSTLKRANSQSNIANAVKEQRCKLTRGSKCVVAVAEKKRSSLEQPLRSAAKPADADKTQLPAKKKIVLTTISSLALSTKEELVTYAIKSYDEACRGKDSLYLTAQKVVNTARVFYKMELNPQVAVEELLMSHVIKGVAAIRKSCAADTDRKCRECQMSSLLLLELEALKRELSIESEVTPDISCLVSHLEEYLTCMSLGRPHLLNEFLNTQLIPSYQLTLAPVLAALLTDFGQDMPATLKRLMAAEMEQKQPSLSSVNSRRSSLPSPAMIPSFNSLFSEVTGNSLMSTSMACRSLQVRSMSDKGRRSIAVPSELLKNRRRDNRLSSKGVASRTRSKTPNKGDEPLLTEFPAGFLSKLKESPHGQTLSAVRRSPRLASLSQQVVPAATKVKRDLFSSPTTSARRMTTRSPRRQKTKRNRSRAESERKVLVADTPLHKQSYSTAGPRIMSPSHTEVVEETPAKAPAVGSEESRSKAAAYSSHRRLLRRKSFYDMERVKSRNVEKFKKLENRMKCSVSAKCSPRRVAKLILKQALSQPTERVATRPTPLQESDTSPVKRLPRIHRKSAGNCSTGAEENTEPKVLSKKKLFASPQSSTPTSKSLRPGSQSVAPKTSEKLVSSTQDTKMLKDHNTSVADADVMTSTATKVALAEPGSPSGTVHVCSPTGAAKIGSRKRLLSDEHPQITKTPIKNQTISCMCGRLTPQGTRRSPRSCLSSQRKVCQFTSSSPSDLHSQVCCGHPVYSTIGSPSPKRLNFLSRKRGTDPLMQGTTDVKTSSSPGDLQKLYDINSLSTTEIDCRAKTLPSFPSPAPPAAPASGSSGAVQRATPQHRKLHKSHISPKYSPLSAGDLQSLLRSPFVNLDNETSKPPQD